MGKLLVIGNGFDKMLGAKTLYSDFFSSDYYKKTREQTSKWVSSYRSLGYNEWLTQLPNSAFNCWDLLFYLETENGALNDDSRKDNIKWCDVESVIHDSLTSHTASKIDWKTINKIVTRFMKDPSQINERDNNNLIAVFLIMVSMHIHYHTYTDFYEGILKDLNDFEKRFGQYISEITNTDEFKHKAENVSKKMYGIQDYVIIDSFNYSDFQNSSIKIRHINGTCDNPIFGVDLRKEEESSFLSLFTKTSRRLRQDSNNLSRSFPAPLEFLDHVVVFGHSLNNMDYDYFNYLFTMLHFNSFDATKMGIIEFLYSIYDPEKEKDLRKRAADSVYDLINYYENYINPNSQHVLINLLRFSGRLRIREWTN